MSPDEILQAVWEYCKINKRETVDSMNNLISQIIDNPQKLADNLSEYLEDWCLEKNICPLCSSEIVQISRNTQSSEYFGQPTEEIENVYGCDNPSCGYIKD